MSLYPQAAKVAEKEAKKAKLAAKQAAAAQKAVEPAPVSDKKAKAKAEAEAKRVRQAAGIHLSRFHCQLERTIHSRSTSIGLASFY